MTDCPRQNDRMLKDVKTTYKTALYSNDQGMWTVIEITERPLLKAASQHEADRIIKRLTASDPP